MSTFPRQSRLDRVNAEGPCLPKVDLADPNTPDQRDRVQRNCFEFALYTPRDHDCISNRIGSGIRNCPRCRCRFATFGALPTSSMIDRAIIMLNDHRFWGHASGPSSSDAPIVPSTAGTTVPPAAAPYRASGLVPWHETDIPTAVRDVRSQGAKRKTYPRSELF